MDAGRRLAWPSLNIMRVWISARFPKSLYETWKRCQSKCSALTSLAETNIIHVLIFYIYTCRSWTCQLSRFSREFLILHTIPDFLIGILNITWNPDIVKISYSNSKSRASSLSLANQKSGSQNSHYCLPVSHVRMCIHNLPL